MIRLAHDSGRCLVGNSKYEVAWKDATRQIAVKTFQGLQVLCPVCHRRGSLISKWLPKIPVKPLFVCHWNGNGAFRTCAVDSNSARSLRAAVGLARPDILKTLRMGRPFVLFSGGQDSLCLLTYLNNLTKETNKKIIAIHANTTAGFPEIEEYVQQVCSMLGVELVTVQPQANYFDLAKRWGIPSAKSRWCCETLKVAPIRRFLAGVKEPKVVFDGIRAAESNLRATYVPIWFHPSFRCISVSPIFRWSDDKVNKYIHSHNLPKSPAAKLGTSAECWCGAYKTRLDFEALLSIHPEIFDKLVEVEKAQKGKYTFLYNNGKRIPLLSLRQKKTRLRPLQDKNILKQRYCSLVP